MNEFVELLTNKIRVLETLLECKDSEIDVLKDCLKEIGTQITVEDMIEPDFKNLVNNPLAKIEIKKTTLHLDKVYVYSNKKCKLLDQINDALSKVQ